MAQDKVKVVSWNVNGIRACHRKGFVDWLSKCRCDVVMLQEVRANKDQIPAEVQEFKGYSKYWFPAETKKGYSGTGILSRTEAKKLYYGMGREEFDCEGRVLGAEFDDHIAVSAYFPNSQDAGRRLDYKIDFCEALHEWLNKLRRKGKSVILGGDYNIAHEPIDLARPDDNHESPGFLPEERKWMSSFLGSNWIDSFRHLHPKKVRYSWWSMRSGARERNVGWRIDYHCVHAKDRDRVLKADILTEVMGSDHCPVRLDFAL